MKKLPYFLPLFVLAMLFIGQPSICEVNDRPGKKKSTGITSDPEELHPIEMPAKHYGVFTELYHFFYSVAAGSEEVRTLVQERVNQVTHNLNEGKSSHVSSENHHDMAVVKPKNR
jgi:hypothetical protein